MFDPPRANNMFLSDQMTTLFSVCGQNAKFDRMHEVRYAKRHRNLQHICKHAAAVDEIGRFTHWLTMHINRPQISPTYKYVILGKSAEILLKII